MPERVHAALVLATYVGQDRSVHQYSALQVIDRDQGSICRFGHGVVDDGQLIGFRVPPDPAPLVALLFVTRRPLGESEAEAAVESALGDTAGWPLTRDPLAQGAASGVVPLRVDGSVIRPWYAEGKSRSGPEVPGGDAIQISAAQRVVEELNEQFGQIYGVWLASESANGRD